jgi:hypothetical protein
VEVGEGRIAVSRVGALGTHWHFSDYRSQWRAWKWWFEVKMASWYRVAIPLWLPFAMVALPAAMGWRRSLERHRWARFVHACKGCGYDRRGLSAEVKCPECGTAPST